MAAPASDAANFLPPIQLPGAAKRTTEPRVAVAADDHRYVVTNAPLVAALNKHKEVVYSSSDGRSWALTPTDPVGQTAASIDTDIITTRPFAGAPNGRLIASELDYGGINFRVAWSDDGGASWHQSQGATLGDTDREWTAAGPPDPVTGKPRVYLLFHNLASGSASHNMFVQTSHDGGETFGSPVPVTTPPSQAWQDLQCADSGGPSSVSVNQTTGQVYVVFGTRTAPLGGGCGSSVFGPFEINVVAATRVWVATAQAAATDSQAGWTDTLAVDDSEENGSAGKIVGMQLSPGALDSAGNLYVAYPESVHSYPNYDGAAVKYVWAPPDLRTWSAPVTVAAAGGPGHVLPHVIAGDPGKLDFAYYEGAPRTGQSPAWYMTFAQVTNGQTSSPKVSRQRLSKIAAYTGTASELMGACDQDQTDPTQGVQNGFNCSRSADVWGIALDNECRAIFAWPVGDNLNDTVATDKSAVGTYVSTQVSGPTICTTRTQ